MEENKEATKPVTFDDALDQAKKIFIDQKEKEYRMDGLSDKEAEEKAAHEWEEHKKEAEEQGEKQWAQITKKIGLSNFLDDQIRRALGVYKTGWEKANAPQTLDFKLYMKTKNGVSKRLIASVSLYLDIATNGVWRPWREKKISFQHVNEMRNEHMWKLKLYEDMFQDLLGWGVSYCMILDNNKEELQKARQEKQAAALNDKPDGAAN